MKTQKLLSICIPTYNRAKFLKECLSSLSKQLNPKYASLIEIVICDNCSNDQTQKEIADFIKQNINFSIINITNKINIGAEKNLILTTKIAKGHYVWFMGDDDIFENKALSKIIPILLEKKYYFLMLNKKVCDKNLGKVIIKRQLKIEKNIEYKGVVELCKKYGYLTNLGFISTSIFKREFFINVNPEPYYETRYPHCGIFLEAFYNKSSLVLSDIYVIQRQENQTEDVKTLFPLMASFYIIKTFRILIEKGILTIEDIKNIKETYLGTDSIALLSSIIDHLDIVTNTKTPLVFEDWQDMFFVFSKVKNNFFNKKLALSYGVFLNYLQSKNTVQIDSMLFRIILNNLINVYLSNCYDFDLLVIIFLHVKLMDNDFSAKIESLLKKIPNIFYSIYKEKYTKNVSINEQNIDDGIFNEIKVLLEDISKEYKLTLNYDGFKKINPKIKKLLYKKNVIIFGASKSGEKCLREVFINKGKVIAFLDNKFPNNKLFNGLKVFKPKSMFFNKFKNIDLVVLASNGYKSEMRKQLEQLDIDVDIIDDTEIYY